MRLLLPAPEVPDVLFYEINVSEEPASLALSGFDGRHRVVAQADVRPEGEFGLASTQILGENAVSVRAALSQTAGGQAVIEGTLAGQPFEVLSTPSKPHVVQAPSLDEPDAATLAHWQQVAVDLFTLALALRQYESTDDPWGPPAVPAGAGHDRRRSVVVPDRRHRRRRPAGVRPHDHGCGRLAHPGLLRPGRPAALRGPSTLTITSAG
jgi:hypothetical protein